jgi:Na+-translocating ferredoxin:NAD+ oxidoreductase RnfC subunit
MDKITTLKLIRDGGVVGAGGGGFPTYVKLNSNVEHIIANGVECEPLLYKDREVMLQESEKMIKGLEIARELTGASKVTIAIKRKNEDVANFLAPMAKQHGMDIFLMENVYPAGDEYIIVYDVTGKRIPPGGIPLNVGCVVDNVETLVNITNAVYNEPVTEKYLTITGEVKEAVTVKVPVGTSFKQCIDLAGGFTIDDPVIVTGGVMMGGIETDFSLPVSKTNGALIVLPKNHSLIKRKTAPMNVINRIGHSACDQCSFCTQLCPRYILGYPIQPHLVMRSLQMTGDEKERLSYWATYCCECNICSLFACPEKLDPKNICVDNKKRLRNEKKGFSKEELNNVFRDVHPVRNEREIPISILYQRLGVKPYDRKAHYIENGKSIDNVIIPLINNMGSNASAIVKVGELVKKGSVIGSVPEDKMGTPVHSSIDGKVTKITDTSIYISSNI